MCDVCDVFISVCAPHTAGGFEVKTSSTSFFFLSFRLFFSLEEERYQRIFLKYE